MVLGRGEQGGSVQFKSTDTIVSQLAQQDKVPWYNKPNLRLLYLFMAPACLGVEMTSGFDSSIVNGLQAIPSWLEYYGHPHSTSLGLMASMYPLGSVAALPFVPIVVDKFGRRYPILVGGILSIFGGILQGCALNFAMFIAARFILGVANIFCVVAASSLIGELSHPKERAIMCSLFVTSFELGALAAAVATLRTFAMTSNWGWRIPSFLQVLPCLFQIPFILFVPESPRWLVSRGRGSDALAILVKYHAEGDKDSDFVRAEYTQIQETLEAELKYARMNQNGAWSTPGFRKRVVVASSLGFFARWCGIGLISYFLPPILDSIGIHDNWTKNVTNLARISWSLVNGTLIALIVPRYPRRTIFLACSISTFLVFTAWSIASAEYSFSKSKVSAQVVLALVFLYSPAYNLAFNALTYTYLVELFPFHVRAKGITIYQWCSRGAAFIDQFVIPIGLDFAGWKWYLVYCVWNAFQVVFVYFVFPETSERTLEELTFLFEGDRREELHEDSELETLLEHGEPDTHRVTEEN